MLMCARTHTGNFVRCVQKYLISLLCEAFRVRLRYIEPSANCIFSSLYPGSSYI